GGGKLQVVLDGSSCNAAQSCHVSPPSVDRKIALGSVPAQTTACPFTISLSLTATLSTRSWGIPFPAGRHESPKSSVTQRPLSNEPPYNLPCRVGSAAKHLNSWGVSFSCSNQLPF